MNADTRFIVMIVGTYNVIKKEIISGLYALKVLRYNNEKFQ